MTTPDDALERARAAAAADRAEGAYAEVPPSLDASPVSQISGSRLLEWSLIEPDVERVYSTRRLGAPITAVKRGLIRGLRQYFHEMLGLQSRFNSQATSHILNLEDRVRDLEERLRELEK